MIEVPAVERVLIPEDQLAPCPIQPLPQVGVRWRDLLSIVAAKDRQQVACNERFNVIREWQDAPRDIRAEDGEPTEAD